MIQCTVNSESRYYKYKGTFSIILLAASEADYCFTMINMGHAEQSDGGTFLNSGFGNRLIKGKLGFPSAKVLSDCQDMLLSFVFVADKAFPLREDLMRPFPGRNLDECKSVFNYWLSRARRVIGNTFGIRNFARMKERKAIMKAVTYH